MSKNNIIRVSVRLNMEAEADRRAWEHLQRERKQYKSYNKAIVAAVNDFFARQERINSDPYLETREKEDAFLKRVMDAVRQGLQSDAPTKGLLQLLQNVQPPDTPIKETEAEQAETIDAALQFADSF